MYAPKQSNLINPWRVRLAPEIDGTSFDQVIIIIIVVIVQIYIRSTIII